MLFLIFLIITAVCFFIGFAQIYGFLRFRSLKHLVIIQKRYHHFVQLECVVCMLSLFIGVPSMSNTELNNSIYDDHLSNTMQMVLALLPRIFSTICFLFIMNIEAARLYLMNYDLQYLHSSKNQRWKVQIDHSIAEKDWYLSNRKKWGNQRFVFKRTLVFYFLALCVTASTWIYTRAFYIEYVYVADLANAIFVCVPIAIINVVFCKLPKANDAMFFHFEYRATAIAVDIGFVIYVFAAAIESMGYMLLGYVLAIAALVFSLSLPSLLSTIVVPMKISWSSLWIHTANRIDSRETSITSTSSASQLELYIQSQQNQHSQQSPKAMSPRSLMEIKMRETLKDERRFEVFIDWMYREFSSEVMLSVIELVQFKQYLKDCGLITDTDNEEGVNFYRKMPRSTIVYGVPTLRSISMLKSDSAGDEETGVDEVNSNQWGCIGSALYEKYIERHSELEVNISFGLRRRWEKLHLTRYPESGVEEFASVCDSVVEEMLKYVRESFDRFDIQHRE